MAPRRKIRKIEDKNAIDEQIDSFIEQKKYYEALQIFHSLFGRLRARGQKDEAEQKIINAGFLFVTNGANDCVIEIVKLLIKSFEDDKRPIDGDNGGKTVIMTFIHDLPICNERLIILNALHRWIEKTYRKFNSSTRFDVEIFHNIANCHEQLGDLVSAAQYFSKTTDIESYVRVILNLAEQGLQQEKEFYISRAILLFLAEGRVEDAKQFRNHLEQKLSTNAGELNKPIVNFTHLTTILAETRPGKGGAQAFNQLVNFYQQPLSSDKYFEQLCSRIKSVIFQQEMPPSAINPMLDMVMKLLAAN